MRLYLRMVLIPVSNNMPLGIVINTNRDYFLFVCFVIFSADEKRWFFEALDLNSWHDVDSLINISDINCLKGCLS